MKATRNIVQAGESPLVNYALPPLVEDCAVRAPGLRNWPALRRRYRRTVDSVSDAKVAAYWKTQNRAKRKIPFPKNKPDYWQALKSPLLDLGTYPMQCAIETARLCEDGDFFIFLGARLENPPLIDPDAENRLFLIRHWLILKPSRVALIETGQPGVWFDGGVIPSEYLTGRPKRGTEAYRLGELEIARQLRSGVIPKAVEKEQGRLLRAIGARPLEQFPGLSFFKERSIADFHAALPYAKRRDEQYWKNQIGRLGLAKPGLLLARTGCIKRETDKVTIRYLLPGHNRATSQSFPLFPEDSLAAKPAWKSFLTK